MFRENIFKTISQRFQSDKTAECTVRRSSLYEFMASNDIMSLLDVAKDVSRQISRNNISIGNGIPMSLALV